MKRFLFAGITWLFCTGFSQCKERTEITICGYNLRNYILAERTVNGQKLPDQPKPSYEKEAVVRFIAEIKPDILGVCEIGSEGELKDLQTRLKTAGVDLPNFEYAHGGDPHRRLALLTRFKIVGRNSQTELKYRIGEQVFPMNRGILDVTVEPRPGFQLRCLGAHLKSMRPVPDADQALMRRNEAHLIRLHLDRIFSVDPKAKLILYGDFNEYKNQPSIAEITGVRGSASGLTDMMLRDSRKETWTHYWQDAEEYSRLDYMFVSRELSPYMNRKDSCIYDPPDYYDGSDHRPVVGKIFLSKK
jgi:endonuclease/exonuclease/phosphatase family metal-dependent hydrolase